MVRFDFDTEEIREGMCQILIPRTQRGKGPGRKEGFPFYNPVMEANRDISVLLTQKAFEKKSVRILDGLAGTGVRGIRMALEVDYQPLVVLNDWNQACYDLILENIRRNELDNAEARQEDVRNLLGREEFDYVDIDPFGTPVQFLENALCAVANGGILAVTATDTATLSGRYPATCMRKYDAKPLSTTTRHEIGIRILLGYIARRAEYFGLKIEAVMSHSTDHYYRTYVKVIRGGNASHDLGYYIRDDSTSNHWLSSSRDERRQNAGPLWIGKLWETKLLMKLRPRTYMSAKTSRILNLIRSESMIDSPYYSSDEIASQLGLHTPAVRDIICRLLDKGYKASPTHFDSKGFRTEAPIDEIRDAFRSL